MLTLTPLVVVTVVTVVVTAYAPAWAQAVMVAIAMMVAVAMAVVVPVVVPVMVTSSLLLRWQDGVSRGLHVWSSLALLWDLGVLWKECGNIAGAQALVKNAAASLPVPRARTRHRCDRSRCL